MDIPYRSLFFPIPISRSSKSAMNEPLPSTPHAATLPFSMPAAGPRVVVISSKRVTRRCCEGGTACSSKACGIPPCNTPTRIMDKSFKFQSVATRDQPSQFLMADEYYVRCVRRSSVHRHRQKMRSTRLCQFASPTDGDLRGARRGTLQRRE